MSNFEVEVKEGKRFEFGKNWIKFLELLDEDRIMTAEKSLKEMLEIENLHNKRFLDVGCGSGLFSLAAKRLGAVVHSFDYDPQAVACTSELKQRYFRDDSDWTIGQASVLDYNYLKSLNAFDVIYAWGVLHHTGDMWQALDNVRLPVQNGGKLFIAIYNDQGPKSKVWLRVKQIYCSGNIGKLIIIATFFPYLFLKGLVYDLIFLRNPFKSYIEHKAGRGMSVMRDWHDWLGGLPFEVAKPEQIVDFYLKKDFALIKLKTYGGSMGPNEFVFKKIR